MDSSDEEALLLLAVAEDDDRRFVHIIIITIIITLAVTVEPRLSETWLTETRVNRNASFTAEYSSHSLV
jgi:hypothetical protein